MGNVAISIRIMPKSPEVDINKIISAVKSKVPVQDSRVEPLAFGLKCIKILIVVPDKQGGDTDKFENIIKEIDGVETVETENVTLV